MAYQNQAAQRRRAMARRLYVWLKQLGVHNNLKLIAKRTGIDMDVLRRFRTGTPKLSTLEKISRFIEEEVRNQQPG